MEDKLDNKSEKLLKLLRSIKFLSVIILLSSAMTAACLYIIAKKSVPNYCPISRFFGNISLRSQYYEDYILSYVFGEQASGVYVDVGVNDPNKLNSSVYFHQKGWKGVNIEPIKNHYDDLVKSRPGQININKAISNYKGIAKFNFITNCDGHSSLKANSNKKNETEIVEVNVDTLTNIFTEYSINEIDFLKIDVEGSELEVVEGLDLKRFRPKVIVLESVSPADHFGFISFEDRVISNNYVFAMTDDLNRYYVRKESEKELLERFDFINSCVRYDKLARGKECFSKHKCSF
jgi:FkbM family methyltransferase